MRNSNSNSNGTQPSDVMDQDDEEFWIVARSYAWTLGHAFVVSTIVSAVCCAFITMAYGVDAQKAADAPDYLSARCRILELAVREVDQTNKGGISKATSSLLASFAQAAWGIRAVWGSYAPAFEVEVLDSSSAPFKATALIASDDPTFGSQSAARRAAADYKLGSEVDCFTDARELHSVVLEVVPPPSFWARGFNCFRSFFVVILPVYAVLELATFLAAPVHDRSDQLPHKVT